MIHVSTEIPSRPMFRYPGGKYRLGPWIISHFPAHEAYVEPYSGAGSVLLQKPRCNGELLNDLDGEVVNMFRVLRNPAQARELIRQLILTPYSREEFDAAYLLSDDPIEQARRSLIKSFMGFGGDGLTAKYGTGFRDNILRKHGTSARDWAKLPPALHAIFERLRGVVIENRPALDILRKHDSAETLFYVDPPYPLSTRTGGTKHPYRFEMTDDDHRALAKALKALQGMVILSGYPCELYDDELFPDWERVEHSTHADGARDRTECLWFNTAAWARRPQGRLSL